MFKSSPIRLHVLPLGLVILMSLWGQTLSLPSAAQSGQDSSDPVMEEFEPDNNGAPDESTGAGGR